MSDVFITPATEVFLVGFISFLTLIKKKSWTLLENLLTESNYINVNVYMSQQVYKYVCVYIYINSISGWMGGGAYSPFTRPTLTP